MNSAAIGVDVGGTTTRVAAVHADGRVIELRKTPTPTDHPALIAWISRSIREMVSKIPPDAGVAAPVGVALPGIVDHETGRVARSVHLPWLEGRSIAAELGKPLGTEPVLMTDAEAATWGEFVIADRPAGGFAHLRLGTGVACCVIVDGRIVPTDPGRRTHWELLIVDRALDAPLCPCSLRGCLELYASGTALAQRSRAVGFANLEDLQSGLAAEKPEAIVLVGQTVATVVEGVRNLAGRFGLTTVVLGGGVMEVLSGLHREIERAWTRQGVPGLTIAPSKLGDAAGVLGAAHLASARRQGYTPTPARIPRV